MKETTQIAPTNSFKMIKAMALIGILCGLLIVLTYEGTLARIADLKEKALQEAIFKVLPESTQTQAFSYNESSFDIASKGDQNLVYAGYDENGELIGLAIVASGQGYADVIRVLYGYSIDNQKIIGFYVLESKETPGLGDKIEKDPSFLSNFEALDASLNEAKSAIQNKIITVKKGEKVNEWEIDGITGATISSRAIGDIIGKSTQKWIPIIYKNQSVFKKYRNEQSQQ
ncbi:FMN-binding protein [Marivirga arenosa]|uniref:Ion-translocating oxidoreductase complex subunit G n=1 Tax=Marivirga arenosa TaxID=3059076 RepID=A0AA49GFY1_9BACT|nr:FMN-binding protein [Marivirga sp. BKB1-2]WKK80652.2 FMN-binding protein [Marivirga sp. BKB1-2]